MKLISFLLIVGFSLISVRVFCQVTLNEKNAPLTKVMKSIESQTGYYFLYDETQVKLGNISIQLNNVTLDKALSQCFKDAPVTYQLIQKNIVLTPLKEETIASSIIKSPETYTLTGNVSDEKGDPIPGAIVFLNNSKKTTSTNTEGTFTMHQVPTGSYELIVKMMGFTSFTQDITVQKSTNFLIKLTESNTKLDEIVIQAKQDPNRIKYLKLFTKNFIGESANASACKILNPDVIVLHFNKEKQILEGHSNDFIKIENLALGYKVSYLLTYFKLDMDNQTYAYEGKPYFEELKASADQQKQWDINRKIAYKGSIQHFFKALFNHTAYAEGFLIYRIPVNLISSIKQSLNNRSLAIARYNTTNINNIHETTITDATLITNKPPLALQFELSETKPINSDSLFSVVDKNFKQLKLSNPNEPRYAPTKLYVVYTKEQEPSAFYNSDNHIDLTINSLIQKSQVSQISPIKDDIMLDKNGTLLPVNHIMFDGYWTWERVADLMPFDYDTKSKIKVNIDVSLNNINQ